MPNQTNDMLNEFVQRFDSISKLAGALSVRNGIFSYINYFKLNDKYMVSTSITMPCIDRPTDEKVKSFIKQATTSLNTITYASTTHACATTCEVIRVMYPKARVSVTVSSDEMTDGLESDSVSLSIDPPKETGK
jgi:hypothetical protein